VKGEDESGVADADWLKVSRFGVQAGDKLEERVGQHLRAVIGGEKCRVYPPSSMLGELDILSIMSSSPSPSPSPS
jgi:hypothetical protein